MSREIKKDFEDLVKFVKDYNLKHLSENNEFKFFVSKTHKKYFSYLTLIAELQNYLNTTEFDYNIIEKEFNFLKESCSDTGNSFFLAFHGSYKASKLILRSSIETFIKGFFLSFIIDIDEETSIFEMFRKVRALPFSNLEPNKSLLNSIHNKYKLLCRDVHTATDVNMANISALNYFPNFDEDEANNLSSLITELISEYITLLCIKYNNQFHVFHYENKKIILNSVKKAYKPTINNI